MKQWSSPLRFFRSSPAASDGITSAPPDAKARDGQPKQRPPLPSWQALPSQKRSMKDVLDGQPPPAGPADGDPAAAHLVPATPLSAAALAEPMSKTLPAHLDDTQRQLALQTLLAPYREANDLAAHIGAPTSAGGQINAASLSVHPDGQHAACFQRAGATATATDLPSGPGDTLAADRNPVATSLSMMHYEHIETAKAGMGGSLFVGSGVVGGGAAASLSLSSVNIAAGLTFALVSGHRVEASTLRRLDEQGRILQLVATTAELMPVLALSASASAVGMPFGGGVRISALHGHSAVHHRFMDLKQVAAHLRMQSRWWDDGRQMLDAFKAFFGDKKLPSLKTLALDDSPEHRLLVGEMVVWKREHGINLSLGGGSSGLRATLLVAHDRSKTLTLARPQEHLFDLTVAFEGGLAVSATVEAPLVAVAHATLAGAIGRARTWRFDVSEDGGREALVAAIDGNVQLALSELNTRSRNDAQRLLGLMRGSQQAAGCHNVGAERLIDLRQVSGTASFQPLVASRWLAGLAHQHELYERDHLAATTEAAEQTWTYGAQQHRERLWLGIVEYTSEIALTQKTTVDEQQKFQQSFEPIVMRLSFEIEKMNLPNQNFLRKHLARAADIKVVGGLDTSRSDQVSLVIERSLSEPQLRSLASLSPAQIAAHTDGDLAPHDQVVGLIKSLKPQLADNGKAEEVLPRAARSMAKMLQKTGSRGFGSLQRLLGGGSKEVSITYESSLYDKPLRKIDDQIIRAYDLTDPRQMKNEHRRSKRLVKNVQADLKRASNDVLLREILPDQAEQSFHQLLDVDEQARFVAQRLAQGVQARRSAPTAAPAQKRVPTLADLTSPATSARR